MRLGNVDTPNILQVNPFGTRRSNHEDTQEFLAATFENTLFHRLHMFRINRLQGPIIFIEDMEHDLLDLLLLFACIERVCGLFGI